MEKIFEINNLSVHYSTDNGFFTGKKHTIQALNNVSLDIYKNEIFSIVGESGCGKSTFIRAILRLENKTSGIIKGRAPIANAAEKDMSDTNASHALPIA